MIFYLMSKLSKREPILELEILVTEARLMGAAQQIGHLQARWMPGPVRGSTHPDQDFTHTDLE